MIVLSTTINFSIGLILHVCMFSHHNIILYIYVLYTYQQTRTRKCVLTSIILAASILHTYITTTMHYYYIFIINNNNDDYVYDYYVLPICITTTFQLTFVDQVKAGDSSRTNRQKAADEPSKIPGILYLDNSSRKNDGVSVYLSSYILRLSLVSLNQL